MRKEYRKRRMRRREDCGNEEGMKEEKGEKDEEKGDEEMKRMKGERGA